MKKLGKDEITYREFNINKDNEFYKVRIEVLEEYINFILKNINDSFDYFYTNKIKISLLINEFKLDQKYLSNNGLILNLFDDIYENNKMIINKQNSKIKLVFQNNNNMKLEINLIKEFVTIVEKLNIIYNEIKNKKCNRNIKIENIINLEYLNNKSNNEYSLNEEKKDIKFRETNDKSSKNDYIKKYDLEIIYKKIENLIIEQNKLYDNIIKNIIENKNNIEKKLFEDRIYKTHNQMKENITAMTTLDNDIEIKYKIYKDNSDSIKIFEAGFVKNNENNFKIIYREGEYNLKEKFKRDNYDINRGFLDIKLKYINYTTDLSYMFSGCNSLISLHDISKWDTSNITNMSCMFNGCSSLSSLPDISKWNTSEVRNMSYMFNAIHYLLCLIFQNGIHLK